MIKKLFAFIAIICSLVLTSCVSTKNITYFQNKDQIDASLSKQLFDAKIMPKDILQIQVFSMTPEASEPFNLLKSSAAATSSTTNTNQNSVFNYLVDNDGNIVMPIIGTVKVGGLTKNEAEELIKGKNVGAHFQAAIPGWLCTTERYSTQEEYLKKVTGTDYIYDFTVTDAFNDIEKYELDSIVRYMKANYPEVDPADTVDSERNKYGLYYVCLKPSDKPDTTFADGAEVHLNYTGMRLDGTIFDTTDEKTAKDAGIYSAGSSYKPTYVKWKENYKEMTMGDSESSAIDGFLYAISHMKPHEKGIVIFHSGYGYGYNGHGKTIPGYSPLAFILELTDNE